VPSSADTGAHGVYKASAGFSVTTASKDVIEISDANPEADFIKIFNSSVEKV